jgi:hypothetical protein
MTNPRLGEPVKKTERGDRHVQHRLKEMRRAGAVPYRWITDATRRGYFVDTFTDRPGIKLAVKRLIPPAGRVFAECGRKGPCVTYSASSSITPRQDLRTGTLASPRR